MPLNSLADVTAMAARLPEELQAAQRRGVTKAALHVTTAIRAEIRADTGGDMRLSGVGARGAKVNARYDVKGSVNPTAIISAVGPLHFLEHDMPPHMITPRGRRRAKRGNRFLSGAKALHFGGRFVASAFHPGTIAKKPFERGYLKSRGQSGAIFDAEVQTAIRKALA